MPKEFRYITLQREWLSLSKEERVRRLRAAVDGYPDKSHPNCVKVRALIEEVEGANQGR